MFTGLVEEIGVIESVRSIGGGIRIRIHAARTAHELAVNDSVSINGVCQTVVASSEASFEVEAIEETLKKTTFGTLQSDARVNLELPLKLTERLGGHLVLGHVDSVGQITEIEPRESSWIFRITVPQLFTHYLVRTGSIAIDGVSLTVAELRGNCVSLSIIPHTMENTIFQYYKANDPVNLEFDVIGKYIERMMSVGKEPPEKQFLTEKHLRELGF